MSRSSQSSQSSQSSRPSRPSRSPSAHPSPDTFSSLEEENVALRRQVRDLKKDMDESRTKSKHSPSPTSLLGRAICRLVTSYEAVSVLTQEADRRALAEEEGIFDDPSVNNDEDDDLARTQDRRYNAFRLLIGVAPRVSELMREADPDSEDKLSRYLAQLEHGVNSSRTDDNSRMKWEVAHWLNDAYNPVEKLKDNCRDNRGLQHDICGMLLSPIEIDWADPQVRDAVRNGTSDFNINESYFLRCFYPVGGIDYSDIEHNFLRSRWLLLAFHAIFISPSVDVDQYTDGPRPVEEERPRKKRKTADGSKANVSTRIGMNGRVTGRAIAYTAVMLAFNLTDASKWSETYNGFSFHGLYDFIVDYFEDTPDPVSKANARSLLQWWNRQVFPSHIMSTADSRISRRKLVANRTARDHHS